jgi:hypothetical protein
VGISEAPVKTGVTKMNFTEDELNQIANGIKESIRQAQGELASEAPTMSQMQSWMVKHHVEHPEVLQTMIKKLGPGTRVGKKRWPECDSALKNQGLRSRQIHLGRLGLQRLQRTYYTCQNTECHCTEFTLDKVLDLSSHTAAGKFEEQICYLSATQTFEQVQQYLANFDQVQVTETMIRETAESCGGALIKQDESLQNTITPVPTKTETLYVQPDGAMVPIRPENGENKVIYKENKLGVIFREEDLDRKQDGSCKIKTKRFVSSLGKGVEHFEQSLQVAAHRCGSAYAKQIVFISDGAEWLDGICKRLFPDAIQILDWYHAEEHLWECARFLFTEKEDIDAWVKPIKEMLWEGLAEAVCEQLLFETKRHPDKQTKIHELYNYYKARIHKMNYAWFRRKGYFIGSGSGERANKYLVKARLCQSGMKWSQDGASSILKLREKIYEKT